MLLITGEHEFDDSFLEVFENLEGIYYDLVEQPRSNQMYELECIKKYDALVFYDYVQNISEEQKNEA